VPEPAGGRAGAPAVAGRGALLRPFLADADVTVYQADVLDGLAEIPDESIHCVVTSPPYWGLRDYGTADWEGGDPSCDHVEHRSAGGTTRSGLAGYGNGLTAETVADKMDGPRRQYRDACRKCGAERVDRQHGLEPTPEAYVARMVAVFRELRRVLRSDGTCWLNIGDSYAGNNGYRHDAPVNQRRAEAIGDGRFTVDGKFKVSARIAASQPKQRTLADTPGLKQKDLVGIPWMLAFALRADGWYLRADIVWAKPNPMPESVTDRPTKAHEYLFLLTKSARYFYDPDAIREPVSVVQPPRRFGRKEYEQPQADGGHRAAREVALATGQGTDASAGNHFGRVFGGHTSRNARSVWEIATQPYPEAHFATFPEELPRRCIAAGTSERGCCPDCGAPWRRLVEKGEPELAENTWSANGAAEYEDDGGGYASRSVETGSTLKHVREHATVGWEPICGCDASDPAVPCTVLDPFAGAGTTALVARRMRRASVAIELNPEYASLIVKRLSTWWKRPARPVAPPDDQLSLIE
jgi:DNA modification methylase